MQWWIIFSLIAMLANVGKILVINRLCQQISSRILVLCSRITAASVMVPILFLNGGLPENMDFWGIIAVTSFFTTIASILYTKAIKSGNLSTVMPMQAAVPIFAVIYLILLYNELPGRWSIFFMVLSMSAVSYTLHQSYQSKSSGQNKFIFVIFSLIAAIIFGICTILDRAAISRVANGALAYSACWNLVSVFFVGASCLKGNKLEIKMSRISIIGIILLAITNLIAFYFQQLSVEKSLGIDGAVVNVKAIVMVYLSVVVLFEHFALKKPANSKVLLTGLIAILASIGLLICSAKGI